MVYRRSCSIGGAGTNPTSVPERGGDECLCSGPDLPVSNPNKTIIILDSMDANSGYTGTLPGLRGRLLQRKAFVAVVSVY